MNAAPAMLTPMGAAAPDGALLADIAARALHSEGATVIAAEAAPIPMPVLNLTTGGVWRIHGTAATPVDLGEPAPFTAVAKLIQTPRLWPGIGQVPPQMRDEMARRYPWRTEAQVYGSRLAQVVPDGARLPEVYGLHEVDHERTVIWMEDVRQQPGAAWSEQEFGRAALWLGRLAGSTAVRTGGPELDAARDADRLRYFVEGVVAHVHAPALQGPELWRIPAVAEAATPELVSGLRALAAGAGDMVQEMLAMEQFPSHGDASPQNLLMPEAGGPDGGTGGDGAEPFVVIDWGLYGAACPGFDLSQLLSGLVNDGAMPAETLASLEAVCLPAYCAGLAQSGAGVPAAVVQRGHALSMALFTGLVVANSPRLAEPDSQILRDYMANRLAMAQFAGDLLADTG